jgi:LmbE family N-acetylglucosaminyl deacetylase
VNGHADHISTHWALRHALLPRPSTRVAMVAYPPSVVEAVAPRLLFATPETDIDIEITLTPDEIDAKEAALQVHEAFVTMREDGDPDKIWRPPIERFALLDETLPTRVDDVFAGLTSPHRSTPPE